MQRQLLIAPPYASKGASEHHARSHRKICILTEGHAGMSEGRTGTRGCDTVSCCNFTHFHVLSLCHAALSLNCLSTGSFVSSSFLPLWPVLCNASVTFFVMLRVQGLCLGHFKDYFFSDISSYSFWSNTGGPVQLSVREMHVFSCGFTSEIVFIFLLYYTGASLIWIWSWIMGCWDVTEVIIWPISLYYFS